MGDYFGRIGTWVLEEVKEETVKAAGGGRRFWAVVAHWSVRRSASADMTDCTKRQCSAKKHDVSIVIIGRNATLSLLCYSACCGTATDGERRPTARKQVYDHYDGAQTH